MKERSSGGLGAYGLRLAGVEGIEEFLVGAPPEWPSIRIELEIGRVDGDEGWVRSGQAEFTTLSRGRVHLDLDRGLAVVTAAAAVSPEELVHPYLSSIGAMAAYLRGEESFHAGAVVVDRRAFAVVGDREAGKSSLLAAFAARGTPVLCDDMLIVRRGRALAGPRSVDLRHEAAAALGLGDAIGIVGTRERWRLQLPPVEAELELGGWIFLDWSHELSVDPMAASERVRRLTAARGALLPPTHPAALLELGSLPAFTLRRPRDLTLLGSALDELERTIRGAGRA